MLRGKIGRGVVVLAMVFVAGSVLAQAEQPKTHKHNAASTDQRGTQGMPLAVKVVATPLDRPETEEQKRERETKQANDKRLTEATEQIAFFTYGLVLTGGLTIFIGIVQLGLFIWQLRLIRISLVDAEKAAKVAKQAADAATAGAFATQKTVDAFINSERPHISFKTKLTFAENVPKIEVETVNIGKSLAYVRYYVASTGETLSGSPPFCSNIRAWQNPIKSMPSKRSKPKSGA